MTDKLGIFVSGANGRMGKNLIRLVWNDPETQLVGASEHPQSPVQGADAGLNAMSHITSVSIAPDLDRFMQRARGVVIDFSSPETTLNNVQKCLKNSMPIVIGTTGFTSAEEAQIREASQKIPVIFSPNMSVGMNLVFDLVQTASKVLQDKYDIEILELHHHHKKDAPSGTASRLAEIICEESERPYPQSLVFGRQGQIGERPKKQIGMQVMRGGDTVGEHTIYFCGEGERIEIKHVASRRTTFALGAIRAAKWLSTQKSGWYNMSHVLGL